MYTIYNRILHMLSNAIESPLYKLLKCLMTITNQTSDHSFICHLDFQFCQFLLSYRFPPYIWIRREICAYYIYWLGYCHTQCVCWNSIETCVVVNLNMYLIYNVFLAFCLWSKVKSAQHYHKHMKKVTVPANL